MRIWTHPGTDPALVCASQEEVAKYDKICEEAYSDAKKETAIQNRQWLDSPWTGFFEGRDTMKLLPTGIDEETLKHIGDVFSKEPSAEFTLHGGESSEQGAGSRRGAFNMKLHRCVLKV